MKLNAYGRKVVAKATKTAPLARLEGEAETMCREDVVLLSDRTVGRKRTFKTEGERAHATGWSRVGKLKEGITPEAWLARKELQGYTKVTVPA
jgi:hypothetical protein